MNTKTNNQQGIAHLAAIIVIVSVLVIGAAGMRVLNNSSDDSNSEQQSSESDSNASSLDSNSEDKEGLESEEEEETKKEEDSTKVAEKEEVTTPPNKGGPEIVNFVKGGGSLQYTNKGDPSYNSDDLAVIISEKADRILDSGTCTFTLALSSTEIVKTSRTGETGLGDSSYYCSIEIPLSEFPKSGIWDYTLQYDSDDNMLQGSGGGFDISTKPETFTANFVKGGGPNLYNNVVSVSSTMDKAYTGTCTFTYSLNGTVRVTHTTDIEDSKTCSGEVSAYEFPKSSTYDVAIDFSTNGGIVQAHTDAGTIVVQ